MNDPNTNKVFLENIKIIFSLNTKRDYFIDWLIEKIILSRNPQLRNAQNNLPNKKFSGALAKSGIYPEETQLILVDNPERKEDKVFFKVTTIGEDRIEISSGYIGNAFVDFSEILLMIARTYIESTESIVNYLELKLIPDNSSQENVSSDGQELRVVDIEGNVNDSIVILGNNNKVNIYQPAQKSNGVGDGEAGG